jgi:hypothetical protein
MAGFRRQAGVATDAAKDEGGSAGESGATSGSIAGAGAQVSDLHHRSAAGSHDFFSA